jgi:hypothetical protein
MWIFLLIAGVGALVFFAKSSHGAAAPGGPTLPAVFTNLAPGKIYMLNVFTTNPPPPATPPDLSTTLVTFLGTQLPLQGAGKVAQVAQPNVDPSALPPEVPRPSPGTTMTQWGVVMLTAGAIQLPRTFTMADGTGVYVQNAFLVMGPATAPTTAAKIKSQGTFGWHMNEPGFMSDQTDIKPIYYSHGERIRKQVEAMRRRRG